MIPQSLKCFNHRFGIFRFGYGADDGERGNAGGEYGLGVVQIDAANGNDGRAACLSDVFTQFIQALTERFIIGTLASYVAAGACGYVGLALMG